MAPTYRKALHGTRRCTRSSAIRRSLRSSSVLVLANGLAGNAECGVRSAEFEKFQAALNHVTLELAKMIVRDGELAVPNAPGLGITLNDDFLRHNLAEGEEYWDS